MRMLLKATFPTDKANAAVTGGTMGTELERVMDQLKPEAAYFYPEEGKRTCLFVFDMQDSSDLPVVAEPLFQAMDASLYLTPVMNQEDVQAGLQKALA